MGTLTDKQTKILTVLCDGSMEDDEVFVDIDQLLERLNHQHGWKTTKQSMQFSIRALINRGLMVKNGKEIRRGRRRVILAPTAAGYRIMGMVNPKDETCFPPSGLPLTYEDFDL